jgi:hypothetical protein
MLTVSAIVLFVLLDFDVENGLNLKIFFYSALIAAVLSYPTNRGTFQFGKYLLLVAFGIFITIGENDAEYTKNMDAEFTKYAVMVFWIIFIIASIISGIIAFYTYNNIDEVLSRRMLYRNSNVSLFEYSWLYTLDRFCNITLSIIVCTIWLGVIIFIYPGLLEK